MIIRTIQYARLLAALVTVAAIALATPAAKAQSVPQLYWTNELGNTIGSATVDGTNINQDFIAAYQPVGIATDGQHLYWGNEQYPIQPPSVQPSIAEANLDGTGVNEDFGGPDVSGTGLGLAVDDSSLFYVSSGASGEITPLGQPSNPEFQFGTPGDTDGVAVDGQSAYFGTGNSIGVLSLSSLGPTEVENNSFITGLGLVYGVAVDNQYIYWTDTLNNSIGRANLDGTDVQPDFITGADDPEGLAVDARHIYWTNYAGNTIGEANLDGTDVNQSFITGADGPAGLAVSVPHALLSPATPPVFASTTAGSLSAPQTLTIANNGASDLLVGEPSLTGTDPADFVVTSNGCLGPVAVGESCPLTVAFAPQASGRRSATLMVPTSDYANSPIQIPLAGTGASPSVLTGTTETCSTSGILTQTTKCSYVYTYSGPPTGPTGATVSCTTTGLLSKTTTCTSTYAYASAAQAAAVASDAIATADIHGRSVVVGTGTIRHHRLTLHFKPLARGRYRLTLWRRVPHRAPVPIGHTTLFVR